MCVRLCHTVQSFLPPPQTTDAAERNKSKDAVVYSEDASRRKAVGIVFWIWFLYVERTTSGIPQYTLFDER